MIYPDKRSNNRVNFTGEYLYSTRSAGNKVDCNLKNISVTGACIATNVPLDHDENVILHICRGKDMSFPGKVVWKDEDVYGIIFNMNHPDEFENISFILNSTTKL